MPEADRQPFACPEPGLRCLVAPNPSPMTYWGTNTYIIGTGRVAVIDPGPDDERHLRAIMATLGPGETISHIFVTHTHLDHSPLAAPLARETGAPIYAFGNAKAGRSEVMKQLAEGGLVGGGEGMDHGFCADEFLSDGETISGENWELSAIWTPGHIANHLCFSWGDRLFSGDHVMGWASSLVSPPDGDLTQFMNSLQTLLKRDHRVYYPGHGAAISEPASRVHWLIRHRTNREASILDALSGGPATAAALTRKIYHDVDPALFGAAERNVLAHLIDLVGKDRTRPLGTLSAGAKFQLC